MTPRSPSSVRVSSNSASSIVWQPTSVRAKRAMSAWRGVVSGGSAASVATASISAGATPRSTARFA